MSKINIYGSARSGTKLIQIYTCMTLIKKYGSCFVVYEPFLWKDRSCGYRNRIGIKEHIKLPLLISNDIVKKYKSNFLAKLTKKKYNLPVISKFVRANGRINLINNLTNTDKRIFILRRLPEVLSSLENRSWNLLGEKIRGYPDWLRLKYEVKKLGKAYPYTEWLTKIDENNIADKNAFFWAVTNHFALINLKEISNKLLLHFDDIKNNLENIFKKIDFFLGTKSPNYDFRFISGVDIHNDFLLINVNKKIYNFLIKIYEILSMLFIDHSLGLLTKTYRTTVGAKILLKLQSFIRLFRTSKIVLNFALKILTLLDRKLSFAERVTLKEKEFFLKNKKEHLIKFSSGLEKYENNPLYNNLDSIIHNEYNKIRS